MQNINSNNLQQIYKNQSSNVFKSWLYTLLFGLLIVFLGFLVASIFNMPIFLYAGFFFAIGTNIYSYFNSHKMVLSMANAKEMDYNSYKEIYGMVGNLATQAGLPMPKLYIVQDPSPNAFATGRNAKHGVVGFTTGILALLNKKELEGVVAHELSHIANRDTLLMAIVAVMASLIQLLANMMYMPHRASEEGGIGSNIVFGIASFLVIAILAPLAATVIQLAISRKREFMADASGTMLTQNPSGLADGLMKISAYNVPMQNVNPAIAHLFISNPMSNNSQYKTPWYSKLFMTHPPVEERVRALLGE
jgi:heat shock protein HtpX